MPALNPLLTEDLIPFLNVTHLGIESNKLEGDDFSYGRSVVTDLRWLIIDEPASVAG